jgi:hemolysin III
MEREAFYTKGEEIANAVTHGIGSIMAVVAFIILTFLSSASDSLLQRVSYIVFGLTMVIMYVISTLYHSFTNKKTKRLFRILDHISVYLLIAGTYTPFTLTVLRSTTGWIIFCIVWALAIAGIVVKTLWIGKYDRLATLMYILMGWLIVISIKRLWLLLPQTAFILLVSGGVIYTLGAVLYLLDSIPYNHSIWHVFVIGGSLCHFYAVISIL